MIEPLKSCIRSLGGPSYRALLHAVMVTSLVQWSSAQVSISPDVVTAAVGGTVTLSVQYQGRLGYAVWFKGGGTHSGDQILSLFGSQPTFGPQYTDRERLLPDGSLEITDVQTNYTGNYTVQTQLDPGGLHQATAQLRVHMLVTKPTIKSKNSQPVEKKETVTLTCNNSSAAETILWFFNGRHLPTDNTKFHLSEDNRTLKISNMSRLDSGIYQCEALNVISASMSDPHTLTVSYGPEDTRIDPLGAQILQVGETLNLSCYTQSVPEVDRYEWYLNNSRLHVNKKQLSVSRVSSKDGGNYTCVAHNNFTRKSANAYVFIAVKERGSPDDPLFNVSAIAGIVIGCLVAVILIVTLVYLCRTKTSNVQCTRGVSTAHGNNGAQTNPNSRAGTEEMHYMTVHFEPKSEEGRVLPPPENTIYAQVKATHHNYPLSAGPIIYSEAKVTREVQSVELPPSQNTIYSQVKV